MAASQNTDLTEITGPSPGYFRGKKLLSVSEIYHSLLSRRLHDSGEKMRSSIENIRSDLFLDLPVEFPVTGLQHATTLSSMKMIVRERSLMAGSSFRREFQDFSFWGADISPTNIEKAQEDAENYIQEKAPQSHEYQDKIRKQFASSPAFNKSASRYGNFRFSFNLPDLLSLYKDQFCRGEKPEMSILGTDIYKQEIAHYIVVHSPHTKRFKDLPRVPSLQTRCEPLPFVYWMGDTLYWRPESTLQDLILLTRNSEVIRCPLYQLNCYIEGCSHKISCAWNQLVFALHIPHGESLEFPSQMIIDNLSACDALDPYMKPKSTRMEISAAEEWIKQVKQQSSQDAPDSEHKG
ncbi:uncharacterized protein ACNLHF_028361 [Anomaloglossus baeobatrachus]